MLQSLSFLMILRMYKRKKSRCEGSKPSRCISQSVVESWQPCHVQPLAGRKKKKERRKVFPPQSVQKSWKIDASVRKQRLSRIAAEDISTLFTAVAN